MLSRLKARILLAECTGRDIWQNAPNKVLGVTEDASDQEVKKAYRRLMSEHHPDKLAARGVPEEMIRVSTEKTAEISKAYDMIKEARGMR